MKLNLKFDSRDKIFNNKFGNVVDLPREINFDTQDFDDVQPAGNVQCTCYTVCDIATDTKKILFDINDLWKRVESNQYGADPRDVFSEVIKNGLLPEGKTERVKDWRSYWRGDIGNRDPFDNVRSAMMIAQSPIGCATYWYKEWMNTPKNGIMQIGKTPLNGHMYTIEGWVEIDNKPYIIVEAWIGRKLLMSREVFNEALKPYGMQTWVLSTSEIDVKREKNLYEVIKDLMINLIINLRDQVRTHKVEPVVPAPIIEPVKPVEAPKPLKRELLHVEARKWLGRDASPKDQAPDNLGCAESVSNIIKKLIPGFPIITGTWTLFDFLKNSEDFKFTTEYKEGNVIISPTGTNGKEVGHVGICSDKWIMSNDSGTGFWLENYSVDSWIKKYRNTKGLKTFYFELLD